LILSSESEDFLVRSSDKKMFDSNSQINRQNERIYAASKNDAKNDMALHSMKKFCFKVMISLERLGIDLQV